MPLARQMLRVIRDFALSPFGLVHVFVHETIGTCKGHMERSRKLFA